LPRRPSLQYRAAPAIGFVVGLFVESSDDFVMLMIAEAGVAVLVFALWAMLPRKPKHPPSRSQSLQETDARTAQVPRKRWLSTWMVCLTGGLTTGVFLLWTASIPTQMQGVFSSIMLKWFAIIMSVASLIGNFAAGPITELLGLQQRLQQTIFVLLFTQLVCYVLFAMLLPNTPLPFTASSSVLMVILIVAGVAQGIMNPLIYELAAELSYPCSGSYSGAVYSWMVNAIGLVFVFILPDVPVAYDSFGMVGACLLSLIGLSVVRVEYPRRQVDTGHAETLVGTSLQPERLAHVRNRTLDAVC